MDSGGLFQQSCGLLEIGVVGRMSVALSAVWNGCSIIIRRKALRFSTLRTQNPAFHNEPKTKLYNETPYFFFGTNKSVIVPSAISAAIARVSESVG